MTQRSHEPEIPDIRRLSPQEIESMYGFISWINRFGGGRAIGREMRRLSRAWAGPIRILDVATGGADIPRAIARWAGKAGRSVSVVCLDASEDVLAYARRQSRDYPSLSFVRGDARALPFAPRSFDYAICSLFLHHLSDEDAAALLQAMDRIAVRGIVICDLIRRRRAVLWAKFLTLFGNAIVRYDGPLSVKRAFTLPEIESVVARAGISWARVRPVAGHHFLISGEREQIRGWAGSRVLQSPR
jgi:ubiquinone/menaquinone biosynthesis C-methylase UbiE